MRGDGDIVFDSFSFWYIVVIFLCDCFFVKGMDSYLIRFLVYSMYLVCWMNK